MRIWQVAWLAATSALAYQSLGQPASTCEALATQSLEWPASPAGASFAPDASGLASSTLEATSETTEAEASPASPSESSSTGNLGPTDTSFSSHEASTTLILPKQTHFPSFSEWKDQHDTHHSLRERLAKASISKAATDSQLPLAEATPVVGIKNDASGSLQPQDNATTDLDKPISYIHPLPFSGTGQPEDPLLPLSSRTNYASFDCSAAVLQSSKQTKGSSSILNNSKDKYMLTPCDAPENFVIIELCEEIDVDALVLANWEFFSSMFKHFQVSGSEVYPGQSEDWMSLGIFRAGNVRAPQVFRPPSLRRFVRYLRLDFQSHYGTEHFCPVSLVRVYGRNHLEAFRDEEAERRAQQLLEQQIAEQQQAQLADVEVQAEVITASSSPADPPKTTTIHPAGANNTIIAPTAAQNASEETALPSIATETTSSASSVARHLTTTAAEATLTPTQSMAPGFEKEAIARPLNATATAQPSPAAHSPRPSQQNSHFPQGESIYGAITKRLTALERDASLTLNYVEEQSKLIQDMFAALDQRLSANEHASTRTDQILRRLMLDQELHRAQVENERTALASQVNVLAEEIVRSKRLSLVQLVGTLLILGFVAATRGSSTLVSMQQMRRSQRVPSTSSPRPPAITTTQSSATTQTPLNNRLHKSVPASGRKVERSDRLNPRVTPLQRVPSKRTAARIGTGIRSAVPNLGPEQGRTSRSSAPAKLYRSQTPPPRFATAGDSFSPSKRPPLTPAVRAPRGTAAPSKNPSPPFLSPAPSRASLLQSPGALSDRWASTSGDELSSEEDSDTSPLKRPQQPFLPHATQHRRMSSSDDPQTPM